MSNVQGVRNGHAPKRPPIGEEGYQKATELRRLFVGMRLDDIMFMSSYGDAVKFCIAIVFGISGNIKKIYLKTRRSDIINVINDALVYYYDLDEED